jgi:hypothetical protein
MAIMPIDPPIHPTELERLHRWCGIALMTAQQIEYGVKYLLWMLSERGIIQYDPDRATNLMEGRSKLTLGQVMKVLGEHVTISDDVAETFRRALEARNRFIHGFLVDRTELIADPSTREGVIDEIKAIRRCMLDGDKVIQTGVSQLMKLYGVDFDKFQKDLMDEVRAQNKFDADF